MSTGSPLLLPQQHAAIANPAPPAEPQAPQVRAYPISPNVGAQVGAVFNAQVPTAEQLERITGLREQAGILAEMIATFTPPSREQAVALTKLQESVQWAGDAITVNE